MRFRWDQRKSRGNKRKHGISFDTAVPVFDDPDQVSIQDRIEGGEERWQTMGLVNGITVLIVAHTIGEEDGDEVIRIISARKATPQERQKYHEGI